MIVTNLVVRVSGRRGSELNFTRCPVSGLVCVEAQGQWVPVDDFDEDTCALLETIIRDHPMMRDWLE